MSPPVGGGSTRKVSASELLNMRERAWGRLLRGSSLVAEVEVKDAHSEQVAGVLGRFYAKWMQCRGVPEGFFLRWPACVAVAVTGIAARYYERGTFWPRFWEVLGYQGTVEDQTIWGRGFVAAIDELGMPTFPDMPMSYLGPILMHTGIPTFCLDDYFRLITQRRSIDVGLDAEGFLAWATGREHRIDVLDMPARRFLQHGTEYALDFVERSFDLLDRLHDPAPDLDGVGLPPRVVARAQQLAAEGRLTLDVNRTRREGRTRAERPRIGLDPFGHGVHVVLPATSEAPDGIARWNVTADGVRTTVRSQAQWPGVAEGAPSTAFSLLRPVRTAVVALHGWDHQIELQVVDPAVPLLVFAEDGRRLPTGMPLPPDVVWVVYPAEHELIVDGGLSVIIEGELPLGWNGWRLRQISLEGARSVELAGLPRTRRPVRGYARPRIVTGDPLPGVATPYGTPVHTRPPEVWLPGETDADTTWTIEVRTSADSKTIINRSCPTRRSRTVTDLWDELPRPLLGSYEITVRGPLGRGARRTVFVAEGLKVDFTPRVRLFGASGLARAQAELGAAIGAQANPQRLTFTVDELSHVAEYRTATESEPLVITPPHVQVMHERSDGSPVWRTGLLQIPSDVFADEPGALLVRIPEATSVPPLNVRVGDGVVQEVPPSGRSQAGSGRYDLRRIADTVREHQQADLVIDVAEAVIRLAAVRPRKLAAGVERSDDRLRLVDRVSIKGLTAGVYAATAPWREPLVAPVEPDGTVLLPEELHRAGPLRVFLQIDDPWVPVEWPRWPEHSLLVPGEGHLVSDDPEETALSRFVRGEAEFPDRVEDLRRTWTLIHLTRWLRPADVPQFLMTCSRPLRGRPGEALSALVELGLGPDEVMLALISSGLAATPVPDRDPVVAEAMWSRVPAVAVLVSELSDAECRSAAERQCGEALTEILETGRDPFAEAGRFGSEVERMAYMTPQQIEGIWRAANVIPRALLDQDTRVSAARKLFDARYESAAKEVGKVAASVVKAARNLLPADLRRHVDRRCHPGGRGGWYAIPAASTAFALIARRAARGDPACRNAEQNFRAHWSQLATAAPDLVTIDFVLAELLVSAEKTERQ